MSILSIITTTQYTNTIQNITNQQTRLNMPPRKAAAKKTTIKKTTEPIDVEEVDSVEQVEVEQVDQDEDEEEDEEEEEVESKPVKKAASKKNDKKNKKPTNNWADESPIQNSQNIQTNIPRQEMPNREFVINFDEVPKFETQKVSAVSVVDLLKVIIVRGSDNKSPNPALSCGAEKLLKQLFRVPSRPRDQEQEQGQGYNPRHNNRGYRGKHYSQRYPDNNSNGDPNENKDDNGEFDARPPYQGNRNQRHPPRQNYQQHQNQHQHQQQHQRGGPPSGGVPDAGSQGGNRYAHNRRQNYQNNQNNQNNRHTQAAADE